MLAQHVGVGLVVVAVKAHAQTAVGLVESVVHPSVHRRPQAAHLGVACFPLAEHFLNLEHARGLRLGRFFVKALSHEFAHLAPEFLVKAHVKIADKVVAFFACGIGSDSAPELLPRPHALANVDAAVVHNLNLNHFAAAGLEDAAHAVPQQNVAHVPEVERLVGVGATEFHHRRGGVRIHGRCAPGIRASNGVESGMNLVGTQHNIQKTLNRIEAGYQRGGRLQCLADFASCVHGRFAAQLEKRENHQRGIALKILAGRLEFDGAIPSV